MDPEIPLLPADAYQNFWHHQVLLVLMGWTPACHEFSP